RTTPLRLTAAGEVYAEWAQNAILSENEMEKVLGDIAEFRYGRLSIGTTPYGAAWILPDVVSEFTKRKPNVELHIHEYIEQELSQHAIAGEFDFAISTTPVDDRDFNIEKLMMEKYVLAVPTQMIEEINPPIRYGKDGKKYVLLHSFEDQPFILMDKKYYLYRMVKRALDSIEVNPKTVCYCSSMSAIYNLVSKETGVSLLPACMSNSLNPNISFFYMDDIQDTRPIYLSYRKNKYLTNAARDFIETFQAKWESKNL
nr:LysR family transcriptional regulator substrate-binding protein [Acetatifactor sp.]